MDAGGISVARAIPIDAALVRDVLIRLRRDTAGSVARWTLGEHGVAELDVEFFPILTADSANPAWSTTARLWDTDGVALVHVVIELRVVAPPTHASSRCIRRSPSHRGGRPGSPRCGISPMPPSTS